MAEQLWGLFEKYVHSPYLSELELWRCGDSLFFE
jgi:hypothetical protein